MITLVLLGLTRLASPQVQTVDIIEINHMYDRNGCHTFSQLIFWDVDPVTRKRHVREWCMVDAVNRSVTADGKMRCQWKDRSIIDTVGMHTFESWTQIDPEREDAKIWLDRVPLMRCAR